jgi:hypothetical protein
MRLRATKLLRQQRKTGAGDVYLRSSAAPILMIVRPPLIAEFVYAAAILFFYRTK